MQYKNITTAISLISFVLAVFFIAYRGLNFSIEFTGGTNIGIKYEQIDKEKIQHLFLMNGINHFTVTNNEIHITSNNISSDKIFALVSQSSKNPEILSVEKIGPEISENLLTECLMSILFLSFAIIVYLSIRFEWKFAVSALIANLHDVVIIIGCFAFFQWEFSLNVLTAVLAVLGYSINESVVVFDRIREYLKNNNTLEEIIDNAINSTMTRTVITHLCTEAMVLSILIFGGYYLHNFALALSIGIAISIYSSVLVASPLLLMFGLKKTSNRVAIN